MRGRTHYALHALPLIVALASCGSIATFVTTSTATAAEPCLAAPKLPAPKGARWFYRFDAKQNKCWHVVWDHPARPMMKAAPQAAPAKIQAMAAPAPAIPAEPQAQPQATDPQSLVTKSVSDVAPDDALVIVPEEPQATTAPDTTEQAPAMTTPAEPAQASADVTALSPQVELPAPTPSAGSMAEPQPTSLLQYVFLALVAIALAGGAVLYVREIRRRRNDVLRTMERPAPAQRPAPAPRRVQPRETTPASIDANIVRLANDLDDELSRLIQSRWRRAAA